jgi:hypothetical protein
VSADKYTDDGDFDYKSLPRDAIEYAIEHIDPQAFPKNLANARAALESRVCGSSPEPAPLVDQKTDVAYTLWVERFLGVVVILYAVLAVVYDDVMFILPNKYGFHPTVIELHGRAAWLAALGLVVIAAVPIFGGLDQSDPPKIRPKFRLVFMFACILIVIAIGVQSAFRIT